jgi:hypothetical protein
MHSGACDCSLKVLLEKTLTAIPSTQLPIEFDGKKYSGVYSVSGNLMIARVPGVGSKSVELANMDAPNDSARKLLEEILSHAVAEGRPV